MRAIDIHRHAVAKRQRLEPLTTAELDALDASEVEEYAVRVEAQIASLVLVCPSRDDLRQGLSRVTRVNNHKRPRANTVLAVTGPNGVGKSTVVRYWVDTAYLRLLDQTPRDPDVLPRWSPEPGMDTTRVPVVWISLRGAAAKTTFQAQIAHLLGYSGSRAPEAALSLLARHGVRVLVVDDCHFLRTQNQWGRAMLDTLKTANNELGEHGGTLLLIGANLDGGDLFGDAQISRRLAVHRLHPFGIDTHDGKHAWQRHLKAWETQLAPYLPGAQPGFLFRQAGLLWRRTQGYVRDLHEVLIEATTTQSSPAPGRSHPTC